MRILMTLQGLDIGGAETHVMELARALAREGHQIILASNGGAYVSELEGSGIRHVTIPMHQRNPRNMAKSLRALKALIQKERPDIVHAHARIPAFLCGILQKQMGFPFITTAHWVFQVTPLLRLMTNWGDRTVAVSEDIKTYLMREYQLPEDQISVTINGIDTETFRPDRQDPELRASLHLGEGPVICHVSRLDESRALAAERLLAVMPRLQKLYPAVQLLLVGGGDREAALRETAERVNRETGRETVVMTGPRTDIAQLVALGDVFVGASRAVLEAMSEEKPVILAGNEGYMGLFRPEKLAAAQATNFCYRNHPAITEDNLLWDLKALMAMPQDRKKALGAYGRQVVLEHYSVARMARDYLRAYEALLHPPKTVRAVISGYYGYRNLGDDAILLAIHQSLNGLEHPVRLTVLSRRPRDTRRQYGLRAVNRFHPLAVLVALWRSDLLISGGGSLLQDRTSVRSLRYYVGIIRLAQRMGKPVFLLANGIGPLDRRSSRNRVMKCVEACGAVTLRDEDSLALLRDLGVTRQDLCVTADPAFTLRGGDGLEQLQKHGITTSQPLLGISVRQVQGLSEDISAFARLCDRLRVETGHAIVFLVMQTPQDTTLSKAIQEAMEGPSYLVETPNDPAAMLAIIGRMDALVSMRLHTIIFAAKQRVPVVGCVYDPKVEAFLKLLHMPSCGTPDRLDEDGAVEAVKRLLTDGQIKQQLDQTVCAMERETAQTTRKLQQLLEERGII